MNQALSWRVCEMRYDTPSLNTTSHSSLSHGARGENGNAAAGESHQSPDERQGPSHRSTLPPLNPRRSLVTRTGLPC